MKKMFIHHIVFRLVAPLLVGFLAYVFVLLFFDTISQLMDVFFGKEVMLCIVLAYIQFELFRFGILRIERQLQNPDSTARVFLQFLGGLFISVLVIGCGVFLYFKLVLKITPSTELLVITMAFAIISLAYNTLYFNAYFLNRENKRRLSKEQLMKKNLEYELEAFKSQINPEFLYSSLESLITLVHTSAEQSEELIDQLASTYRYTLNSQKDELVPISQEVKALKQFVAVLNQKNGHLISLDLATEKCEENQSIIPNTLHWLVQYVVANTLISKAKPLILRIYCEQEGYIILETDLNPRLKPAKNASQGFDRTQRAYSFFTETPLVQVRVAGKQYLKMPPLHAQVAQSEEKEMHKNESLNTVTAKAINA